MAYQVPITQKYCTCTDENYNPTQIGYLQKDYEKLRNNGVSFYDAMEKLGIKRLCCRETLFNPPFLFLNNDSGSRIIDKVGLLTKQTDIIISKRPEKIISSPDILPKKEVPKIPV